MGPILSEERCPVTYDRRLSVPEPVKRQIQRTLPGLREYRSGLPPDRVTVTSYRSSYGRAIVEMRAEFEDARKKFRLIFYKRGYNLGFDTGDRYTRLASYLVEMYRHFSLHPFSDAFRAVGIEADEMIGLIDVAFRNSLAKETFRERPAGADTNHIYLNEEQTIIVKDLKAPPETVLRLPGVTVDAMASYRRAQAYHGHLAIRYLAFPDLAVRVLTPDGQIVERTIERAIVQKFVSVLMEEELWDFDLKGRRCRGILAEAIEEGDLDRAKLLIECWLLSVRAKILRGLINFDIKPENYGYDPSVGRVGALDLGQVFAWDDFIPEQADLFIRELQNVRDRICTWASICPRAGPEWAEQLKTYLEESVCYVFRIRDGFCFDIRKDVRQLRAETDYEELEEDFRDLSGRHINGVKVCFAGTDQVRREASRIIARHLRETGISLPAAEMVFARIGFQRVMQEYQLLRHSHAPIISEQTSYAEISDGDFVGLKAREMSSGPLVQPVLRARKYRGRVLSEDDLSGLRREVAKCLIRYYTPGQDVYRAIARRFDLDDLYVSYRLPMERELSKIRFLSLSREDRQFLSDLLDVDPENITLIQCGIAFDNLFERRLYPSFIGLKHFQIKRKIGKTFRIEIVSFGGLIQKVRESDVLIAINERLGIGFENIFEAVEEYLGIRGATLFLEAAYHQTKKSYPSITGALETRLDYLFREHHSSGLFPHSPAPGSPP